MNLDKSKKRIVKKVKMGFQGYPKISISYTGPDADTAKSVVILFVLEEDSEPMKECFQSGSDAREDDVIQSSIVKIIERSGAKTIEMAPDIKVIS